jgi:hypothetical protein
MRDATVSVTRTRHTGSTVSFKQTFRGSAFAITCLLVACARPDVLVTQAEYDMVRVGMPWEEVADAIPSLPTDMTASTSQIDDSQSFNWRNSDGSTAVLTLRAGVVSSKIHFGALPRNNRDFCQTAAIKSPEIPRQRCKSA